MAKSNTIKKLVNGEIADADDVNQIVEDAGNEGGGIPYDPTSHNRSTNGSQSLGSTPYPWGSIKVNRDAELVEVDISSHTAASTVAIKNLRRFIYLKDAPSSYSGKGGQKVSVKPDESGLEFSQPNGIPSNIQVFTSSGTWTRPAGIDKVYIKLWGAGGGGYNSGSGSSGSVGGDTSFAGTVTVTAGGGNPGDTGGSDGSGGSATNADIGLSGGGGIVGASGARGGDCKFGGIGRSGEAGGFPGAGGAGGIGGSSEGGGGGAYAEALVAVTGDVTVTIGAGGSGGTGALAGANGMAIVMY